MGIKNTSLVTAIFDIGRDKWDSFGMSYHTYLWWMRNILYLDTNIVIYTEEKFVEDITNYRKEVDPDMEKTIMVVQPLEEIEGYKKFFDPLNNLMNSEEFKSIIGFDVPEMTKPLYNVVMFAKLFYIKDAYEKNYFNSDLFVWVDAGVIRETNPIKNTQWPDLEKINKLDNSKVTFFCHHPQVRVDKKEYKNHALSQTRFIHGGAVFVPKTCVNETCDLFEKTALGCINDGYVGSDEKIFDFVYLSAPEKFNLIQCGWREYIDLYTSDEQLQRLKPQVEEVLETYNVVCEWKESEVEKCDDYGFWFFCVEDGEGNLIVRDDIEDPNMLNFSLTKKTLTILSSKKPENFVIWPTSKSKGYLTALKKEIKFVSDDVVKVDNKITIDDYFFVNLDRRKDRLEFIKKQINKSELLTNKIKKWTGIDGREVNPDWIPSSIITKRAYDDITSGLPNSRGLSLTPGGLGFCLTHTKLWDYSVGHNKTIFVMDDDIHVNDKFDIELDEIISELPETFDFCYLGYYDTQYEKIPYSEKLFIPKGQFCGPHGYIISPKGAKKLLKLVYPIDIQLDSKLYTIQNQIEYYAAYERLATYVDEYPTDIQNETGCVKNYEKTEVIKDIDNINFKVVVSRYNEDISWTNQLKYESIIYNKNSEDLDSFENNLPNVGREGHTFINFIVENYDNLPDYVAFLQGNPFDHCGDVINIINNYDFTSHFVPLGDIVNLSTSHTSINDQIIKYSTEMGFKVTFPVNMVPGAQHIISKDLILKNGIEFYKKVLGSLSVGLYPQSSLDFEKTLFQLYGVYK